MEYVICTSLTRIGPGKKFKGIGMNFRQVPGRYYGKEVKNAAEPAILT